MIAEAYKGTNQIHEAEPHPEKEGFVSGWLKVAPGIAEKNGQTVLTQQYIHGKEWPQGLYTVASWAKPSEEPAKS